jgi:hypothetical protein
MQQSTFVGRGKRSMLKHEFYCSLSRQKGHQQLPMHCGYFPLPTTTPVSPHFDYERTYALLLVSNSLVQSKNKNKKMKTAIHPYTLSAFPLR